MSTEINPDSPDYGLWELPSISPQSSSVKWEGWGISKNHAAPHTAEIARCMAHWFRSMQTVQIGCVSPWEEDDDEGLDAEDYLSGQYTYHQFVQQQYLNALVENVERENTRKLSLKTREGEAAKAMDLARQIVCKQLLGAQKISETDLAIWKLQKLYEDAFPWRCCINSCG